MQRTWVVIIAAVCGVVVVALGVRHFVGGGSEPPAVQTAARQPETSKERGGWIAQSKQGTSAESGSGSAPAGSAAQPRGAAAGASGNAARDVTGGTRPKQGIGPAARGGSAGNAGVGPGEPEPGSETIRAEAELDAEAAPGLKLSGGFQAGGTDETATGDQATTKDEQAGADNVDAAAPPPPVAYESEPDTLFALNSQVEAADAPPISSEAGTISFWFRPEWGDGNQDDATLLQLGDTGLQVIKNVNFLRFEFRDNTGADKGLGANIAEWKAGGWHQVAATWTGGLRTLYVDGQPISQERFPGQFDLDPKAKLLIGSDFPESRPVAPGTMARVQVLNQWFAPNEVANQFKTAKPPAN